MNILKKISISIMMMVVFSSTAQARNIKFGTGGSTGNYYSIGNDIINFCGDELPNDTITNIESGGSVENLLGLQNKKYSLAEVQEDVLNYYAKLNPKQVNKNRMKVVTSLHNEAVHLLIPKGYKPEDADSGWFSGFGGDDAPTAISLSSLKNQTIGSWGGSIISTEALSYFFNLNLHIVNVPKNERNVNNTSIPLILVGGHPYSVVEAYLSTGKWSLIPLNYAAISQVAPFYTDETVAYTMNGKAVNTKTVGVQALLIAKSYRKKSSNTAMSKLATCIMGSVADLADDPDTNPLWGNIYDVVDDGTLVDWDYFPIDEEMLKEYE